MNEQKNKFESFFKKGLSPDTVMAMADFDTEMNALKKKQDMYDAKFEEGSERHKTKMAEIKSEELAIYKKFNDDYRRYLQELQGLSQQAFDNAKKYGDKIGNL